MASQKPKKAPSAGANKMTTQSKKVTVKKSENGKANPADAKEVKQIDIAQAKKVFEKQIAKFQKKQ